MCEPPLHPYGSHIPGSLAALARWAVRRNRLVLAAAALFVVLTGSAVLRNLRAPEQRRLACREHPGGGGTNRVGAVPSRGYAPSVAPRHTVRATAEGLQAAAPFVHRLGRRGPDCSPGARSDRRRPLEMHRCLRRAVRPPGRCGDPPSALVPAVMKLAGNANWWLPARGAAVFPCGKALNSADTTPPQPPIPSLQAMFPSPPNKTLTNRPGHSDKSSRPERALRPRRTHRRHHRLHRRARLRRRPGVAAPRCAPRPPRPRRDRWRRPGRRARRFPRRMGSAGGRDRSRQRPVGNRPRRRSLRSHRRRHRQRRRERRCPDGHPHPEAFERVVDVNLSGVWRTFKSALPHVEQQRGYLLATSSMAAFVHSPLQAPYTASKAGVWAMCNSIRLEVRHLGVDVGTLHPTFLKTPMMDAIHADPAGRRLWRGNERGLWRMCTVDKAVRSIMSGIERRAQTITACRAHAIVAAAPGFFRPFVDRVGFTTRTITEASAASSPSGGLPPTSPTGSCEFEDKALDLR